MGGASFETPFDMLTGCHERIRIFTKLAERITTEPAPADEVAEAASRLVLYFGTALPLHEDDEEETLRRAMSEYGVSGIEPLFARLHDEHRAIEAVLQRLLPLWRMLSGAPDRLAHEADVLGEGAAALAAAFTAHLEMEESELYPLARRSLSRDVQAEMLRAMRARREPLKGALHVLHANVALKR